MNDQLGDYWFFVDNPNCPDNILETVLSHCKLLLKDEAPLFDDQPQPYWEIFVMRADGTHQRPLMDNQWEDGPGTWQPAGKLR